MLGNKYEEINDMGSKVRIGRYIKPRSRSWPEPNSKRRIGKNLSGTPCDMPGFREQPEKRYTVEIGKGENLSKITEEK
jgi:hypothetical protein